ncbi:MAG TPA: endonuclease III [Bacteroidales bacterium]|nr:endonuclease III [Bacteroidales bacterium]
MQLKERYKKVIDYFLKNVPEPETELEYTDPFELVVAVILSAQCTDKRVNMITPGLLRAFPDVYAMSKAGPDDIFPYISSCTYPNNKARHLAGMARMLVERFNGKVPDEPGKLMQLPGVGRKTANVVASVIYRKPVMAVDTHVFRVSKRIGLAPGAKTPYDAEKMLSAGIPLNLMHNAHHWLILHGRYICKARRPLCEECGIKDYCAWYKKEKNKNI